MAPRGLARWVDARLLLPALIFTTAFAARLGMVYARGGSLRDSPSYDSSVYYAAADALLHGRLPYRDFTLLHPPAQMLALTPFAALGRVTTDHFGFVAGSLTWMALGATNSLLVLRIARRLQLGTTAAVVGAFAYALWYESTRSEFALRLEPFGNFLVLLAVLAYLASARSGRRVFSFGCGAALGVAASVKIWYVVPLLIVLGWHLVDRRPRRQLAWAAIGTVAALIAVDLPFLLLAGPRMWSMVVTDQLGRGHAGGDPTRRLAQLASGGQVDQYSSWTVTIVVALLALAVFVVLCRLAWRRRVARLVTVLAAVQLSVLLLAPSFFPYYSDYLTPSLALTLAAAVSVVLVPDPDAVPRQRQGWRTAIAWLPVAAVAGSAMAIDLLHPMHSVTPAPDTWLQRATAGARCVQSDSPMALIQLDALSRDLADHCPLWVDVTGRTYAAPLRPTGRVGGRPATRKTFAPWQHALLAYLRSGQEVVVIQPRETGISRTTLEHVLRGPTIGRADGYVLHRV